MAGGHVRQQSKKKGTWEIRIELPRDAGGKRIFKYETVAAKNQTEAKRILRKRQLHYEAKNYVEPASQTLEEYLLFWLDSLDSFNTVRPKTLSRYEEIVKKHLIPAIGSISLAQLQPIQITRYYKESLRNGRRQTKGGLSNATVRQHHSVLRRALESAVRQKLIPDNPAAIAERPRENPKQIRSLTSEELNALLQRLASSYIHVPSYLGAMTGARQSEILGLKWADIDFDNGLININRALHWGKNTGWYLDEKLKSKSAKRTIEVENEVMEYLLKVRNEQDLNKALLGEGYHDYGLVCCKADGSPLISYNVSRRFTIIAKSIGLIDVTFHVLRHTFATQLLAAGVPVNDVSKLLGHAKPETTVNIYGHALPSMKKKAADIMRNLVHGNGKLSDNNRVGNGWENGAIARFDNIEELNGISGV
jgi:integrase